MSNMLGMAKPNTVLESRNRAVFPMSTVLNTPSSGTRITGTNGSPRSDAVFVDAVTVTLVGIIRPSVISRKLYYPPALSIALLCSSEFQLVN